MSELGCYLLAQEIEQLHAMNVARVARGSKRSWWQFYDAHAATELGSLIYNRLRAQSTSGADK